MKFPFTEAEFLQVFADYNNAVWPGQIILYLLAVAVVGVLLKPFKQSGSVISILLVVLWIWMGVVYHLIFFSAISKVAWVFGALFIAQALLFFVWGVLKASIVFNGGISFNNYVGAAFILYALVLYQLSGSLLGQSFPRMPTFGLPCPTVIFTLGVLLFTGKKIPVWLLIIPLLWSIIGFTAALAFGIWQDVGLLVAGITTFILVLIKNKQLKHEEGI